VEVEIVSQDLASQRAAGALLLVAIVPLGLGLALFVGRNGVQGGAPRTAGLFAWERGSILTAAVLTALGLIVLESALDETGGRVLARAGAYAYLIGAALLAVAEATRISEGEAAYPLIVSYVMLAFLGQAAVGGALLQSGAAPAWIGWATVVLNVGLPILLVAFSPADIYYPVQHHLMPLIIGIALLTRG
jgi:hypothetical protein